MPLGTFEGGLLVAGSGLLGAATYFYKAKRTLPFKAAYFLTWPVLGTGVILTVKPALPDGQSTLGPQPTSPDQLPAYLKNEANAQSTVGRLNSLLTKDQ